MKSIKLIFFIFSIFATIWLGGLIWFVKNMAVGTPVDNQQTDVIIVLTGGSERLFEALSLLKQNYASRLFVSGAGYGVTKKNLFKNAGFSLKFLVDLEHRIEIGYEAKTTHGNAIEVQKWIAKNQYRSIRLVTSNYHMERSYLELRQFLPDIKIIKHAVASQNIILDNWWQYAGTRNLIIHEYNKLLAASLKLQRQK